MLGLLGMLGFCVPARAPAESGKAYGLTTLARDRVVNDLVGGVPVVIVFDGASESGAVFRRDHAGAVLTFRSGAAPLRMVDEETRSDWDGLTGSATSGSLAGAVLDQVSITFAFWFAWSGLYPETDLFA